MTVAKLGHDAIMDSLFRPEFNKDGHGAISGRVPVNQCATVICADSGSQFIIDCFCVSVTYTLHDNNTHLHSAGEGLG